MLGPKDFRTQSHKKFCNPADINLHSPSYGQIRLTPPKKKQNLKIIPLYSFSKSKLQVLSHVPLFSKGTLQRVCHTSISHADADTLLPNLNVS